MPQPLIKRPERKKESTHEYHTFDDNWCYTCNENVDDEGVDFPYGANQWNKCHTAFTLYEQARYAKVMEVYEKFKHLDRLFCDPLITDRETLPEAAQYELWLAIKEAATYDQ